MRTADNIPEWVVCPLCHGDLAPVGSPEEPSRVCRGCASTFPIEGGIPILLSESVRAAAHVDDSADGYHRARHAAPSNIQYYDFWCEDLLRRLPARRFERVVELMAGGAELSRRARGLPRPIVAVDLSQELLALSFDELVPDTVPVCSTAERLPFRDASLDLVMIQGGLHHVRRHVGAVLTEIARCMAPGAVLLASEPRNDNPLNRLVRRIFYSLHPIPDEQEEDGFTRSQLQEFLDHADLELRQYDPFAYIGYILIGNTDLVPLFSRMRRNWLSSLLIAVDRAWAAIPLLREFGWASQIVVEKPAAPQRDTGVDPVSASAE